MSIVNIALQIVPKTKTVHPYDVVDKAIEIIKASGVKYVVCPFETVMEGEYEQLMEIVDKTQAICLESGADELLVYIKIQRRKDSDVFIDEKTGKYS